MMWIPAKGAFRAGVSIGAGWDDMYIGVNSFAVGNSSVATGVNSFAAGAYNSASGYQSMAFGSATNSSGICSATFGSSTNASGVNSTAFGYQTFASGLYSTSYGEWSTASGPLSFASGSYVNATGTYSEAFGRGTTAQSYNSFVLGSNNYNPGTYSATTWVATEPIFVIGNGTSTTPSNAVTVLKNGNTGIGVTNPQNKLEVCGTIRSKEWIVQTGWCDYKFEAGYQRMTWEEKMDYISKFKHLPEIDPGQEIESNGLQVAKAMKGFIWNIEDNTMDIISLYKENSELKNKVEGLEKRLAKLENK